MFSDLVVGVASCARRWATPGSAMVLKMIWEFFSSITDDSVLDRLTLHCGQ